MRDKLHVLKAEEMLTCDAWFLPDSFQKGLPRARDQVDVVLQLHKEILLFQRWLKLLSPAERRISYTDGTACVAKTQQRGRKCVTHNSTTENRLTVGSLFTHTALPFSAGMGSTACGSQDRLVQSENH